MCPSLSGTNFFDFLKRENIQEKNLPPRLFFFPIGPNDECTQPRVGFCCLRYEKNVHDNRSVTSHCALQSDVEVVKEPLLSGGSGVKLSDLLVGSDKFPVDLWVMVLYAKGQFHKKKLSYRQSALQNMIWWWWLPERFFLITNFPLKIMFWSISAPNYVLMMVPWLELYCRIWTNQRSDLRFLHCCDCREKNTTRKFLKNSRFLSVFCDYRNVNFKYISGAYVVEIPNNWNNVAISLMTTYSSCTNLMLQMFSIVLEFLRKAIT